MIYTGGFFEDKGFVDAFANSDASVGLVLGSAVALLITVAFYLLRQSLPFADCMDCLPEGFKQMVPAMLILSFAWALKAMTDSLGAAKYVAALVESSAGNLMNFLPAIIFLIAVFLAFASGTSWGTFGILIPIVVSCFQGVDHQLMIISISVGRRPVYPSESCYHPDSLCLDGCGGFLLYIPGGRFCQERPGIVHFWRCDSVHGPHGNAEKKH